MPSNILDTRAIGNRVVDGALNLAIKLAKPIAKAGFRAQPGSKVALERDIDLAVVQDAMARAESGMPSSKGTSESVRYHIGRALFTDELMKGRACDTVTNEFRSAVDEFGKTLKRDPGIYADTVRAVSDAIERRNAGTLGVREALSIINGKLNVLPDYKKGLLGNDSHTPFVRELMMSWYTAATRSDS